MALNDEIVIENLDIFKEVGRGVAHDEGKCQPQTRIIECLTNCLNEII